MADGIFIETKSLIDGAPVVVIFRGRRAAIAGMNSGANSKTGAMVQTYILRSDIPPSEAASSGADSSVCGDCPHRPRLVSSGNGAAPCYVELYKGPRVCWEAYRRGSYRRVSLLGLLQYVTGAPLRIGSYGDPGAVDPTIWIQSASVASSHTGYTHRYLDTGDRLKGICMASVDSAPERDAARAIGWDTFRVSTDPLEPRVRGEARCPASKEAGRKVQCVGCPLPCNGRSGSRVILDHAKGHRSRRSNG